MILLFLTIIYFRVVFVSQSSLELVLCLLFKHADYK